MKFTLRLQMRKTYSIYRALRNLWPAFPSKLRTLNRKVGKLIEKNLIH